ncbi:nucleotidyltransferase family protein [uncultured Massilia sp.]|uniref:nucleotidyltransferase domain-containing protein n=1 Tax=uncultured Massilia sp. TaxID=169973 RepID=UPI0025D6C3F8|nr:nucleotidyltransferase family protein [uncultured Massilia sp.]
MMRTPSALPLLPRVLRDPARLADLSLADWDLLLRQCASVNLTASLLVLVEEQELLERIPAQARTHLEWARAQDRRQRQAVRFEVENIAQALHPTGLPVLLLKGAAYTTAGLRAGAGRLYGDVDILVPKARLDDVESALMLHGWATTHHDPYDQRYYREWMHELPPMQHLRRRTGIDVHHAILPETAPVRPAPALLLGAARALPRVPGLAVLAPVDMVLHSATHLFFESELDKGMRDLFDLHLLLGEFGAMPGFWDDLVPRARQLQLGRPLFYALRYCRRLLGTTVPQPVLDAAAAQAPPAALLWLMDRLFGRALLPPHASCADAFAGTARFLLYLRGTWLRMPPLLLARHLLHKAFVSSRGETAS